MIRVGDGVARPSGYKTAVVEGDDAYERAAAVDRFFSAARGRPSNNVVLYSGEEAGVRDARRRLGRPLGRRRPAREEGLDPAPILRALREHESPNVYVLGPERVDLQEGRGPAARDSPIP